MKIFLKLKHWQLFGIYLILLHFSVSLYLGKSEVNDTYFIKNVLGIFALLIPEIFIFNWIYSIGNYLFRKVEVIISSKDLNFKYFILSLQIIIFHFFINLLSKFIILLDLTFNNIYVTLHNFIIVSLSIVSILSYLYVMYFIAKSLKSLELNNEITFKDFRKEFFLLVLLPIGIWFIQPRINKIFAEEKVDEFG